MKYISNVLALVMLLTLTSTSPTQIVWTRHLSNPIFTDTTGGWTLPGAHGPSILHIDSTYHMWYVGFDGTNSRIGYATSLDGISWEPYIHNPVLDVGLPGSYEETDVIEPSVIYDGSIFHMWYTGLNFNTSPWIEAIGYATSPDGMNWTKDTLNNPVLEKGTPGRWDDREVFSGSVIFDGSTYHMWYSGAKIGTGSIRNTGYATSPDGYTWTKDTLNNPVLSAGSNVEWDYPRAAQPEVYFDGTIYHMFYGGGVQFQQRIGYATSPNKINWTKDTLNNPVFDVGDPGRWDDYYVNIPSVIIDTANSIFRMWYTGGTQSYDPQVGYAHSPITSIHDGILNAIPQRFILHQNYPNPFNPSTTIEFDLPKTSEVSLKIFNIHGEEVATLVSDRLTAGNYTYEWDASNLASGVYLYRLQAGD
jgi:predicted GH43/DUF377 family glycosyl hydrolase